MGAAAASFRVASWGTIPANSPPTKIRWPASASARARPALSFSTREGLVPHVGLGAEEKNWGAGPLGRASGTTVPVTGAAAPARAAMPTTGARADAGAPKAVASPQLQT